MITLYHCLDARSFRPLWTLEEMGLPYELKMLPFPPRVLKKEYLEVNPLGTIPYMIDGDTRMTESAAICQYLVSTKGPTPLNVRPDEPGYGAFLNYLHFGEATLTFPQTIVLRYRVLEPGRAAVAADDYAAWFLARLRRLEPLLSQQEYLAAGRFTAADVSVAYALLLAHSLKLESGFTPAVREYWARMSAREGFARAKASQAKAAEEQGVKPTVPL